MTDDFDWGTASVPSPYPSATGASRPPGYALLNSAGMGYSSSISRWLSGGYRGQTALDGGADRPFRDVGKMSFNLLSPNAPRQTYEDAIAPYINEGGEKIGFGPIDDYYAQPGGMLSGLGSLFGGIFGEAGSAIGSTIGKTAEIPLAILGSPPTGLGLLPQEFRDQLTEATPTLLRDTVKLPETLGDVFESGINGLGLLGRAIERTYAGIFQPDQLPPEYQGRVDSGEWTRDQALDEMVLNNAGYSDNGLLNLTLAMVLDPINLLSFGVGAAVKGLQGTEKLAAGIRLASASERSATGMSAADDLVRVAREMSEQGLTFQAKDITSRHQVAEAIRMVSPTTGRKGATAPDALVRLSRLERFGLATMGPLSVESNRTFVQIADKVDTFANMGMNKLFGRTDLSRRLAGEHLGAASTQGLVAALKVSTVDRLAAAAEKFPGGREVFLTAIARGAADMQNQWIAGEYAEMAMKEGTVPQMQQAGINLTPQQAAKAVAGQGLLDRNIGKVIELMAERMKPNLYAVKTAEQVELDTVGKFAEMTGGNIDRARAALGAVDEDVAVAIHLAYYYHKGAQFHRGVKTALKGIPKASLPKGVSPSQVDRLTVIKERHLTSQRAKELLKQVKAKDIAAVRAGVEAHDEFNFLDQSLLNDTDLLNNVRDWIEGNLAGLTSEVELFDPATGLMVPNLPKELAKWAENADKFGYRLALAPPDDVANDILYRITKDADGRTVNINPWVDFNYDDLPAGALNGVLPNRWGKYRMQLTRGVRQERIMWSNRRRFVRVMAEGGKDRLKVPPQVADRIFTKIYGAAAEAGVQPRGLPGERIYAVAKSVLNEDATKVSLRGVPFTERQVVDSLLIALEGDLSLVGATQKLTGKVKSKQSVALGKVNFWGQMSENLYPLMRFSLNPVFLLMEFTEGYILNAMRGIATPLRAGEEGFERSVALTNAVQRILTSHSDPTGLVAEQAEVLAMHTRVQQEVNRDFGTGSRLGRIVNGVRKHSEGNLRIGERKSAAIARATQVLFADRLQALLRNMMGEEKFRTYWADLERHFGETDRGVIAMNWVLENLGTIGEDGKTVSTIEDLVSPLSMGKAMRITKSGAVGTMSFRNLAEALDARLYARDLIDGSEKSYTSAASEANAIKGPKDPLLDAGDVLYRDLRDGTLSLDELRDVMHERGLHNGNPTDLDRNARLVWNMATGATADEFWKTYRAGYARAIKEGTAVETRAARDTYVDMTRALVQQRALRMGITEEEFLAQRIVGGVQRSPDLPAGAVPAPLAGAGEVLFEQRDDWRYDIRSLMNELRTNAGVGHTARGEMWFPSMHGLGHMPSVEDIALGVALDPNLMPTTVDDLVRPGGKVDTEVWREHLTDAQRADSDFWQSTGYIALNGYLRGGGMPGVPTWIIGSYPLLGDEANVVKTIAAIDDLVARGMLPADMDLARGLDGLQPELTNGTRLYDAQVGDVYIDPGFQAWSRNRYTAESFADGVHPVRMEMTASAGESFALIDDTESEFLMGRDVPLRVVGRRTETNQYGETQTILTMEPVRGRAKPGVKRLAVEEPPVSEYLPTRLVSRAIRQGADVAHDAAESGDPAAISRAAEIALHIDEATPPWMVGSDLAVAGRNTDPGFGGRNPRPADVVRGIKDVLDDDEIDFIRGHTRDFALRLERILGGLGDPVVVAFARKMAEAGTERGMQDLLRTVEDVVAKRVEVTPQGQMRILDPSGVLDRDELMYDLMFVLRQAKQGEQVPPLTARANDISDVILGNETRRATGRDPGSAPTIVTDQTARAAGYVTFDELDRMLAQEEAAGGTVLRVAGEIRVTTRDGRQYALSDGIDTHQPQKPGLDDVLRRVEREEEPRYYPPTSEHGPDVSGGKVDLDGVVYRATDDVSLRVGDTTEETGDIFAHAGWDDADAASPVVLRYELQPGMRAAPGRRNGEYQLTSGYQWQVSREEVRNGVRVLTMREAGHYVPVVQGQPWMYSVMERFEVAPTGKPGSVELFFEKGASQNPRRNKRGRERVYIQYGPDGKPVSALAMHGSHGQTATSTGERSFHRLGYQSRMYDYIQDHTDENIYEQMGREGFTEAGAGFAMAWLRHRQRLEAQRANTIARGRPARHFIEVGEDGAPVVGRSAVSDLDDPFVHESITHFYNEAAIEANTQRLGGRDDWTAGDIAQVTSHAMARSVGVSADVPSVGTIDDLLVPFTFPTLNGTHGLRDRGYGALLDILSLPQYADTLRDFAADMAGSLSRVLGREGESVEVLSDGLVGVSGGTVMEPLSGVAIPTSPDHARDLTDIISFITGQPHSSFIRHAGPITDYRTMTPRIAITLPMAKTKTVARETLAQVAKALARNGRGWDGMAVVERGGQYVLVIVDDKAKYPRLKTKGPDRGALDKADLQQVLDDVVMGLRLSGTVAGRPQTYVFKSFEDMDYLPTDVDVPPGDMSYVEALQGSTGPVKVQDAYSGHYWVDKEGGGYTPAAHAANEVMADDLYREFGVAVPQSKMVTLNDGQTKVRRARFLSGGQTYSDFIDDPSIDAATKLEIKQRISENFALDALLGNWDAVGLTGDNILIVTSSNGRHIPVRIDNGGALRFRAMGALKDPHKFPSDNVEELATLLNPNINQMAAEVYGVLKPMEIRIQVLRLHEQRAAILRAVGHDPELVEILEKRLDAMLRQTEGGPDAPEWRWGNVGTPPSTSQTDALTDVRYSVDYGETYTRDVEVDGAGDYDRTAHRKAVQRSLGERGNARWTRPRLLGAAEEVDKGGEQALSAYAPKQSDRVRNGDTVVPDLLEERRDGVVHGATHVLDEGRVVLQAFESADAVTGLHELTHVFARDLDDSMKTVVRKARGDIVSAQRADYERRADELDAKADAATAKNVKTRFRNQATALRGQMGTLRDEAEWGVEHEEFFVEQFQRWLKFGHTTNPALVPAFNYFKDWVEKMWNAIRGKHPEMKVHPDMQTMLDDMFSGENPAKGTQGLYDVETMALRMAAKQQLGAAYDEAHQVHLYKRDRGFLERSMNHPYIGVYPSSYMWGKVLPEMLAFLALRPFGFTAPFLAWNVSREVSDSIRAQGEMDESFRQWQEDNEDAFMLFNMLFPALPQDIPANVPLPIRRLAEQGLEQRERYEAGAEQADIPPVDWTKGLSDAMFYAFGPAGTLRTGTQNLPEAIGAAGEAVGGALGQGKLMGDEEREKLEEMGALRSAVPMAYPQ